MTVVDELKPEVLRRRFQPEGLGFTTTDEVPDLSRVVGQPRAVAAVEFGVGIGRDGYNVFALGAPGTGKESFVRRYLEARAAEGEAPPDLCYVHNFVEPERPRLLRVPAGVGGALRRDMARLVEEIGNGLRGTFESEEYQARRQAIDEEAGEEPQRELDDIARRAKEAGLALLRTPVGLAFAPARDGEVLPPKEFQKLSAAEQKELQEKVESYQEEVQKALRQLPAWDRERRRRIRDLNREITGLAMEHPLAEMRSRYAGLPDVLAYLEAVAADVVDNARDFVEPRKAEGPESALPASRGSQAGGDPLRRFAVNLLVDNGGRKGASVVFEDNPTYDNLLGRIDHLSQFGALLTDFTLIKAGALHRANGGYLVLDAHRLLRSPYAWEALKRALLSGQLRLESLGHALSLISTVSLEPEPLPLDVQVVLLGEPFIYYLLCHHDPDFPELFKVAADFDDRIDADESNLREYVQLIATLVRSEELAAFDAGAVARVLEESARRSGARHKLTGQISTVADLLKEADHFARRQGAATVSAAHVEQAVAAQVYRSDRLRQRIYEEIHRGTVLIETEGARVGQVNGLSVLSLGSFSFGRPSRITARVRLGRNELVDIEREVELGGPIHSKGVLILSGFLTARYAPEQPPALWASLVFEQSYGGVEGDSASAGELFALLSAIARVPLRQDLAVTGSVNQQGEIQAIGGVNEKIEGFFDVCRARELTGTQGVLIPASNVQHLMLRPDVVEAAAAGRFHVYPMASVDQGIELLAGEPAPDRDPESGEFPEGTFNRRVADRLAELAALWQEAKKGGGEGKD